MGSSLSTMSAQSCLQQQRDAYPYMFHHDPLSSLASASYGRSCGAAQSAQSHMGGYGSSLSSTGGSQGAGIIFLKPYSSLLFINTRGLHTQRNVLKKQLHKMKKKLHMLSFALN